MGDIFMDYGKIGQRIKNLRKRKNLSQEQLAEKVWISTTHMSHIETASTKLSLPVLVDIAKVLDVSVDEILFGNTPNHLKLYENDIAAMLRSCTEKEAKLLISILKDVKNHLDEIKEN